MNKALIFSKKMISKHGISVVYTKESTPAYNPSTGVVASTKSNYTIQCYPKQIIANQYSFPNLIGKEVICFYIDGTALSDIKVGESILYTSRNFKVVSYNQFFYEGTVYLWKVYAVAA